MCAEAGPIIASWVYEVLLGARVFIVVYDCVARGFGGLVRREKHSEARLVSPGELDGLNAPQAYKVPCGRGSSVAVLASRSLGFSVEIEPGFCGPKSSTD